MIAPIGRVAALLLALAASACAGGETAAPGAPGSVTIHMGGSVTSFAAAGNSSR